MIDEVIKVTDELEDIKSEKKKQRIARKKAKEQQHKRSLWEKMVAPILLIVTVLISALVWLW